MLKKSKNMPEIIDKELSLSLSLEKFQELFKPEDKKENSRLKYLINDVFYSAKTENDAVLMSFKFLLESFTEEYQIISLVPQNAVIKTKKIPKEINFGAYSNIYYFLLNTKGKFEIELEFYLQLNSKNAVNKFNFSSVASGEFSLEIPSRNAKVSIANINNITYNNSKENTQIKTNIPKGNIAVSWKESIAPHSKDAIHRVSNENNKNNEYNDSAQQPNKEKITPIIYSEIKTSISVNETIIQCNSNISYKVYKAGVEKFELEVFDGKIVNIDGDLVKNYDIKNTNKVTIYTEGIIYENFNFTITYEKDIEDKEADKIVIPTLKSSNVNRETGRISLSSDTNIELSVLKQDKLVKIDIAELPDEFKTDMSLGSLYAFKYFNIPYLLDIKVTKHKELPVVVAMADYAMITTVLLKDGKLLNQIDLKVRNNSQTFVKLFLHSDAIPLSATVNSLTVKPVKGDDDSIMIPIDKSSDGEKIFKIKFLFNIETEKIKKSGDLEIKIGSLEIPIKKLYWELYFPESHNYKKFKGNLEKADGFYYDEDIHSDFPVDVKIPKLGKVYRFEDYFLNGDEIILKFQYKEIFKLFKSNNVQALDGE